MTFEFLSVSAILVKICVNYPMAWRGSKHRQSIRNSSCGQTIYNQMLSRLTNCGMLNSFDNLSKMNVRDDFLR